MALAPCPLFRRREMETTLTSLLLSLIFSCCFFFVVASSTSSSSPVLLRGVNPLDTEYFESELIKCKDGSNSFIRDRVNDDFCDCFDGTDEPGTSACANGKFHCRNLGSTPHFLFSSRVNDHICDCCDGSDEYDGALECPNTCIMVGSINYKAENHRATTSPKVVHAKEIKLNGKSDLLQNLKDLKVLVLIQLIVLIYILALWLFYHRFKSRRRRHH